MRNIRKIVKEGKKFSIMLEKKWKKQPDTSKVMIMLSRMSSMFLKKVSAAERKKSGGFVLSRKLSEKLSKETIEVLGKHGLSTDEVDVTKSIAIMEKSNKMTADKLRKNISSGTTMIKMGSTILPADYFSSDIFSIWY